jgi:GNAT superfamily N-acetyltransferase
LTITPQNEFSKFRFEDYNSHELQGHVSTRPFQIRSAVADDIDQLAELASELLMNIRAEGTAEDARRVFQHIMNASERGFVLVAQSNKGPLCGYAYASYEWRAEFRGETMDIVALYVAPQWRGKGVGSALISGLLENARQRGIHRISAEVHPGNAAIERILEASGFDPERRTLWGYRI